MSKAFGIGFAAMVVVLGIVIWTAFSKTAGNHLAPTGSIGKVRTLKIADDLTFVVIDFNVKNDSDRDMVVRTIAPSFEKADGTSVMGSMVAANDSVNAFHTYPVLGEQYNPPFKERDAIPAHQTVDRMVGVRFDVPIEQVDARKRVLLNLQDVTGVEVEMTK
jgi:hypothetical protein